MDGKVCGATALRVAGVLALALVLANCSGTRMTGRGGGSKYGVKPSPKVVADGEPIPKGGGRAMTGKPYVVGSQTYVPESGRGYDREGWASWYGTAFHGRLTANGEVFDRDSIAAAHPTLPLPSYVRVTNLSNRRSMIVRVNDRGPYERSRMVDVSERVAETLEFHRKGTTRVRLEYLGKASLAGSDDRKLLATLRIDGTPAPFGRTRAPVMMADLRQSGPEPEAPRAAVARMPEPPPRVDETSSDEAGEPPDPGPSSEPPSVRPSPGIRLTDATSSQRSSGAPDGPVPAAARADTPTPPAAYLPPTRPVLAGIY